MRDMTTGSMCERLCVVWHHMRLQKEDIVPAFSESTRILPGTYIVTTMHIAACSQSIQNMFTRKNGATIRTCADKRSWVLYDPQADNNIYTEAEACTAYFKNRIDFTLGKNNGLYTFYKEKEQFGIYPGMAAVNNKNNQTHCLFCLRSFRSFREYKNTCGTFKRH